jgi:hypothetical protein
MTPPAVNATPGYPALGAELFVIWATLALIFLVLLVHVAHHWNDRGRP